MIKILILGGKGFIGKNLVESLKNDDYFIRIYDKLNSETYLKADNLEFHNGDLGNLGCLKKALEDIDVVIHLISTTNPAASNLNPHLDINENLLGTLNLLDLMASQGVKKIIFASTGGAIYGDTECLCINELHQTAPKSSYGIVKLAIEKYLELYRVMYGINYIALRFSNPYGRYQNPHSGQGAIGAFIWNSLNGKPIEVWGDGTIARDFIYISDVISSIHAALLVSNKSFVVNIGSGQPATLNDIIFLIEHFLSKKIKINYSKQRNSDIKSNCLDISKAKFILDWTPTVKLNEGIQRTIEYYRNMGNK